MKTMNALVKARPEPGLWLQEVPIPEYGINTNPLGVADCAAAIQAIEICDSPEGRQRLRDLQQNSRRFRQGIASLGLDSIPGPHTIVPVLVRDTAGTHRLQDQPAAYE